MSQTELHTDTDELVKAMLTENTGRHMLDSGGAYGRNWEENNKTPPWEKDRLLVSDDYIVRNVYHWLTGDRGLERSKSIVEREQSFYDWANTGDRERDSWLTCMKSYAGNHTTDSYRAVLPNPITVNTYNSEFGALSQIIQFVAWHEGETAWVLVQIHGGCDVRGGYTKPRLFRFGDVYEPMGLSPMEFDFYCHECKWGEMESCLEYDKLVEMLNPEENTVECPECDNAEIGVM